MNELKKLLRALLYSAKENDPAQARINIISANIKILEGRPDDDVTRERVVSCVKMDLKPYQLNSEAALRDLSGLKLHGVGISFSSVDRR